MHPARAPRDTREAQVAQDVAAIREGMASAHRARLAALEPKL
jgi:hypothetical protein